MSTINENDLNLENEDIPPYNPNINYNVYNALNLLNEELGQSYLDNGFNPLGERFELSEEYVEDVLENDKNKEEINSPDFLQHGPKVADMAFKASLENATFVLGKLNEMLNNPNISDKVKLQIKKIIEYILCRNELIRLYLKKKKKEKDTLRAYQNLTALNWQYGKCLQGTFNKEFNIDQAMQPLVTIIYQKAESVATKENAIIEQAKQIIQNNQKLQAQQTTKPAQAPAKQNNTSKAQTQESKQASSKSSSKDFGAGR